MNTWQGKRLGFRIHRASGKNTGAERSWEKYIGKRWPGSPRALMSTLASFAHLAAPCPPFSLPIGQGAVLCCVGCCGQTGIEDSTLGTGACSPLLLYGQFQPSFLASFPIVI